MDNNRIQLTDDGSHTIFSSVSGETYHSTFGAIQESKHIFIDAALSNKIQRCDSDNINILEVGIGTGLNVISTFIESIETNMKICYDGYEPFPITEEECNLLNYPILLDVESSIFKLVHTNYNQKVMLSDRFQFSSFIKKIQDASLVDNYYDIVYFDAFSPDSQPELWNISVFRKLYNAMANGGILTTYSCKGVVKRALVEVGFNIEKLPGPPGKREFLRAVKP